MSNLMTDATVARVTTPALHGAARTYATPAGWATPSLLPSLPMSTCGVAGVVQRDKSGAVGDAFAGVIDSRDGSPPRGEPR